MFVLTSEKSSNRSLIFDVCFLLGVKFSRDIKYLNGCTLVDLKLYFSQICKPILAKFFIQYNEKEKVLDDLNKFSHFPLSIKCFLDLTLFTNFNKFEQKRSFL